MTLEAEKVQLEIVLLEKVKSLRQTLDVVETKLKDGSLLYNSDGFQGNTVQLDITIARLVAIQKFLDSLKSLES